MNITRMMKGTITFTELENMPNWKSHTLYKQYIEWSQSEEAQQAAGAEELKDTIEDAATGGA